MDLLFEHQSQQECCHPDWKCPVREIQGLYCWLDYSNIKNLPHPEDLRQAS